MSYDHNANRAQFADPEGITIEYSNDGGITWNDYGATDAQKSRLVDGQGQGFFYGKNKDTEKRTINDQLRITVNASKCGIYTNLKTILIEGATGGQSTTQVKIEIAYRNSENNFNTIIGTYPWSGWSGWNSYSVMAGHFFGGNYTQTSNWGALRFTFFYTELNTSYTQIPCITQLRILGTTYWQSPSNMARHGHIYNWDTQQNAQFPAGISLDGVFNYQNIETTLSANAVSNIWFSHYQQRGRPVSSNAFQYNPGTNTLIVGTVQGNALTASKLNHKADIILSGDVGGAASSTGESGWDIKTTIPANTVTNAMLAGSIANNKLTNSAITIAGNAISLGGSLTAEKLRTALGLSSAMHFIGTATVAITDGSTTDPKITGYATKQQGDVIIDKESSYEYVWTGTAWERLGGDSSYKTIQSAVADPAASGNSSTFIKTISQDTNGVITATKATIANFVLNANDVGVMSYNGSSAGTITLKNGAGINITNAGGVITFAHSNTVAAKATYGSTATTASADGGSIVVTDVKYDAQGHITGSTDRTIKLSQTTYTLAGLMGGSAKGSTNLPVYWDGTKWEAITSYGGKAATAGTADKTAHSITVNGSTFDGSANVDTGAIGIAYGGTGAMTRADAWHALSMGYVASNDINDWIEIGTKSYGGETDLANSPAGGNDYGIVINYLNSGTSWNHKNNWIWQLGLTTETGNNVYLRHAVNQGNWTVWSKFLTNHNFNTYAPKLDGTGATGTWAISINGTAAKATSDEDGNKISTTYLKTDGNGSAVTNLNASNITTGTLAAERLETSGVSAGSYGPAIDATPDYGATFNVPYVTVDNKGRITAASTKTIKIPDVSGIASVSTTGTGNAITEAAYNTETRVLTFTKGATYNNYSLPAATTAARGGITVGAGLAVDTAGKLSNAGVRSIQSGGTNGTIAVNTNGTTVDIAVKGLGTAAYTNSNAYAAAVHTHSYVPLAGGTMTGALTLSGKPTAANEATTKSYVDGATGATILSAVFKEADAYKHQCYQVIETGETLTEGKIIWVQVDKAPTADGPVYLKYNTSDYYPCKSNRNELLTYNYFRTGWRLSLQYSNSHWNVLSSPDAMWPLSVKASTSNAAYPLFASATSSPTKTNMAIYNPYIAMNPSTGSLIASKVYGAVWNDYAEFRSAAMPVAAGRVVYSNDSGELFITTERLQAFEGVTSDTYGFAIGETETAKTPLAVAGRVLVYTDENRYSFHSGDTVCAGKNGTISKMTREEIINYPDRIVGVVSEIPEYKTWGTGNIAVNDRIWITVK